jgi:hypothetical protein
MYLGKTLFAQAMDFLPWKTFHRIVNRYGGDHRTRSLSCAEQFRVMAFAQLTYRESLRDIEVCLAAQAGKLYHMGISAAVARSTLADANESRDWRIYFELAQRLITKARALYVDEDFGVELANTVYALDATTIDLCLSMFPWAPFCSTKAAVKLHTLLDLRGSIPTFIHISDGKMHDVNVLDLLLIEAGAFYIMDRGYLDFERLYALDQAGGFFITRAKRNLDARRVYSAPVDRDTGLICDQTIALNGFYAAKHYPAYLRRIRYRDPETGKNLVFLTNQFALPALTICALYRCRWQVELFFKWIKQHLRIKTLLRHFRERCADANLDRHQRLRAGGDHQEETSSERVPAYAATDFVADALRETAAETSGCGRRANRNQPRILQATESIRVLTGHYCCFIQI